MILSFKNLGKGKIFIISLTILTIIGLILFLSYNSDESYAVSPQGKYSTSANDKTERLRFLSQFGWEVQDEEIEICDIIIPNSFNKTFEDYNKIQQQQGLDLSKYMGKTCQRFTYKITNYPNSVADVYADLLIYDKKVIGGDICSCEMGGFMHGFFLPDNEENIAQTSTGNVNIYPVEKSTSNRLSVDKNMPNAPID